MQLPNQPSQSTVARNPKLWPAKGTPESAKLKRDILDAVFTPLSSRQSTKVPNKTEARYRDRLVNEGHKVMEQAITLRLDPPFKSYRADLAYVDSQGKLVLTEVKAPHRFMEKGIAKAALAAKTYPMFRFELALWKNKQWKVSVLSP